MSLLPPQAIDEFQVLWKERYGTELPREDAAQRAHQVFTLVRLLAQAPPSAAPTRARPPGTAEAEAGR